MTPFANALRKLIPYTNADGKKVIQSMIKEMEVSSPCVEKDDVDCIQKHLAQSVGITDMIELQHDVEPELRKTMAEIRAENEKVINELKTTKSGPDAVKLMCDVRNKKAKMIDAAIKKL